MLLRNGWGMALMAAAAAFTALNTFCVSWWCPLGGYVVEDGDAVFGVVELTVARAEERIADGEDVVLIVFARVPRIPRFDGIKCFGDLAFVELLEGIADFLFADFAGNFHATVDKLLNSIELRLEIGRARHERAVFALGVRRFALEQTGIRHRLAFGIVVRVVLFQARNNVFESLTSRRATRWA